MNLQESFRVAIESIWSNKLRAGLTMLGIIIGVAAVISVVAIGQGGQAMILGEIEGLGTNIMWVYPRTLGESLSWERVQWLEEEDIRAIQSNVPGMTGMSPENIRSMTVRAGTNTKTSSVIGVSHSYDDIRNLEVSQGRFFTSQEVEGGQRVAVVASNVPEEFFDGRGALGDVIYIDGMRFSIVGILEETGGGVFADRNANDYVYVPYTALQRLLGERRVDVLYLQAGSPEAVRELRGDLVDFLDRRFGEDKFTIQSLNEILEVTESVTGIMTNVVAGIAAIALLVGGIGIMNIMLVSVTERTREIGVRKALGARRKDLLYQFIVESVVLSGIGGMVGIVVGGALVTLVARLANLPSLISFQSVLLAFLFAASVGVIFGVYPASKAAKLDPIEALRYE